MNTVNINGSRVSWAFVMRVKKIVGGEWDVVMDVFWKARKCTGGAKGVMKYIEAGFKKQASGAVPYNLQPSKERESGNMKVFRDWWNTQVYQRKRKNEPMNMRQIFQALATGAIE
jgi:hypothetical protein